MKILSGELICGGLLCFIIRLTKEQFLICDILRGNVLLKCLLEST